MPFDDKSFDYVVALDLVEHLDGFHEGLEEMFRVANKELIILIPNMAHLFFRLRFLFKGKFGYSKYTLDKETTTKGTDRHRWVTTVDETDKYLEDFAKDNGVTIEKYYLVDSFKKDLLVGLSILLGLPKSLYVWSAVYIIKK